MRAVLGLVGLGLVVASAPALAGGKTLVVASGDCSDGQVLSALKDLEGEARRRLGAELLEPETALDIVRPRPSRSLQDVQRQVESARALLYAGQPERALGLAQQALQELERAVPQARPAPLIVEALTLSAQLQKSLGRRKEMAESFRRLVRLDPDLTLDPETWAPSTVAAFEAVKKELARGRRLPLSVRVTEGAQGTVLIDGRPMGTTPLAVDLLPGAYLVSLMVGEAVSFPHPVEVPRDFMLTVDLRFEGDVPLQPPLCLRGPDDAAALRLAGLVAAERLIVVRNAARRGEPASVAGTLYEVASGRLARSGAVRLPDLPRLVTFLVTGEALPGVLPGAEAAPRVEVAPQPSAGEERPALGGAPGSVPAAPPGGSAGRGGLRAVSYSLIGFGALAAIAGSVVFASGDMDRLRLAGLELAVRGGRYPSPADMGPAYEEVLRRMPAVDANRALTGALLGGGVGAVLGGVLGLVLFPAAAVQVTPAVGPDGAAVSVGGAL